MPTGSTSGSVSEKVPRPVSESSPTKTRYPTPEASRPGTSTSPIVAPPIPEASIIRTAPTSGDPSSALTAAKLPVAPSTDRSSGGPVWRRSPTIAADSPPPSAISGASGPMTAPRPMLATAARKIPGRAPSGAGPRPAWKPSAGDSPPRPGR